MGIPRRPYGSSVWPSDICAIIRLALKRGWKPSERGSAFVLGDA